MVVMTDDLKLRKKLIKALKQNGGYCPCMVEHIPDNACKCKEFRDMVDSGKYGECRCSHCGAETLIRGDDFTIDGPSQKDVEVMRILRTWYKQECKYV